MSEGVGVCWASGNVLEGGFDKIEIDSILVVFHFADDAVVKDGVGGFEVGRLLLGHLLVGAHWYRQKL